MTTENEAQVALRLDGITKRFGALTANDAISLDVSRGEVVALLGENGAGKTTLMNILFGHYTADEGRIEVFGRPLPPGNPRAALEAGIGMVHQHFTLAENLSVLDNVALGTRPLFAPGSGRRAARARLAQLARDFGLAVDPDARVADLTVGQKQRVEILKALFRDARVLILDEPTAVLTPQEAEALFATLRRAVAQGLAVIFISHKLHEVMAIADRCVVLRHGKLAGTAEVAQTDARRLAAMMVGAEVARPKPSRRPPGDPVLRLRGVTTRGESPDLKSINLSIAEGQIVGLAGVSGNGQAALARLIGGLIRPEAGRFELKGQAPRRWSAAEAVASGVARIPEDRHREGAVGDFDLAENAVIERYRQPPFSRGGLMAWSRARRFAEGLIAGYDVRGAGVGTPIRQLSGGNMQKLILGRVLDGKPALILANQPVRGLDIGALTYVHEQLIAARERGAGVLLISEDLDEITGLSDVIHVISEGRLSPPFARGAKTVAELGLWMAGAGFENGKDGHAA